GGRRVLTGGGILARTPRLQESRARAATRRRPARRASRRFADFSWPRHYAEIRADHCRQRTNNMYERILVPVDGSPFSEEVLPYARSIAQAIGAKLALMRVTEREAWPDGASP